LVARLSVQDAGKENDVYPAYAHAVSGIVWHMQEPGFMVGGGFGAQR
jgi:hypothetical protein